MNALEKLQSFKKDTRKEVSSSSKADDSKSSSSSSSTSSHSTESKSSSSSNPFEMSESSSSTSTSSSKKEYDSKASLFSDDVGKYSSSNKFDFSNDKTGSISQDYLGAISYLNHNSNVFKKKIKFHDKDSHKNAKEQTGLKRLINNDDGSKGKITYADGTSVDLAKGIADSFDSVLDLYIQREVEKIAGNGGGGNIKEDFLTKENIEKLRQKNIVVKSVQLDNLKGGHAFSFSLVDDNGNIMQDENGNLGSCIFADCLNPDGYMQNCEMNFPNILDQLGYECLTKADFKGTDAEYQQMLNEIEQQIATGAFKGETALTSIFNKELDFKPATGKGFSVDDSIAVFDTEDSFGTISDMEEWERREAGKSKESSSGSVSSDLQNQYNKALQAKVSSYKSGNGGNISQASLAKICSQLNAEFLRGGNGYRLDDIKKAQKIASSKIKTSTDTSNNTETNTENTDTTAKQQTEENSHKDKEYA